MKVHGGSAAVQESGCMALVKLSCADANLGRLAAAGAAATISAAMSHASIAGNPASFQLVTKLKLRSMMKGLLPTDVTTSEAKNNNAKLSPLAIGFGVAALSFALTFAWLRIRR
eukprot:TRINITY_DN2424_c1_g2_i1.p2 TRINITY_DN2424_c1_g2~~TRINITY_DN2424_c1_g2_i1.p2  ORF type:complete len:114 (+),score=28.16 TRINITY_DN2424_c1_g2_i1:207-548(+)